MREISKFAQETFKYPMKEDEVPSVKEINKRFMENFEEAFELGILQ